MKRYYQLQLRQALTLCFRSDYRSRPLFFDLTQVLTAQEQADTKQLYLARKSRQYRNTCWLCNEAFTPYAHLYPVIEVRY